VADVICHGKILVHCLGRLTLVIGWFNIEFRKVDSCFCWRRLNLCQKWKLSGVE